MDTIALRNMRVSLDKGRGQLGDYQCVHITGITEDEFTLDEIKEFSANLVELIETWEERERQNEIGGDTIMDRRDVFKLIDGERDYQDKAWANRGGSRPVSDAETSVAAWIIYMKKLLVDAETSIYNLEEKKALEFVRKITALGVACMEHNDTPARKE